MKKYQSNKTTPTLTKISKNMKWRKLRTKKKDKEQSSTSYAGSDITDELENSRRISQTFNISSRNEKRGEMINILSEMMTEMGIYIKDILTDIEFY